MPDNSLDEEFNLNPTQESQILTQGSHTYSVASYNSDEEYVPRSSRRGNTPEICLSDDEYSYEPVQYAQEPEIFHLSDLSNGSDPRDSDVTRPNSNASTQVIAQNSFSGSGSDILTQEYDEVRYKKVRFVEQKEDEVKSEIEGNIGGKKRSRSEEEESEEEEKEEGHLIEEKDDFDPPRAQKRAKPASQENGSSFQREIERNQEGEFDIMDYLI